MQEEEPNSNNAPLPLNEIKNGNSYEFRNLFPYRSFVFLLVSKGIETGSLSNFFKLNVGVVKSRSTKIDPTGKASLQLNLGPPESILLETEFFLDYQRENGQPATRNSDTFAGVLNSAANTLLKGQLKDIITNFWDNFFVKLLDVPSYGFTNYLSSFSNPTENSILSLTPPESAYTENFAYESQVISSFNLGQFISFWDIFRSYATPPLYEVFVDPLETISIAGSPNAGVSFGKINANTSEINTYSVGQFESKVVFRPTPFYQFGEDGTYRDLNANSIDLCYYFALEDLKEYTLEESGESICSAVHVCLNVYSSFGTVLCEPKYNNKIRDIIGPKFLTVKIGGLNFKEESLTANRKPIYKNELSNIRDNLFEIFCNLNQLKNGSGSFLLPFCPIRVGMPFRILIDSNKNYGLETSTFSEFGDITDVYDEFVPAQGYATTQVIFKWAPTTSDVFRNL